jgi:biopolymer transport protein ExbB
MTPPVGQTNIGFTHFLAQSDTVGKVLLVILVLMSIITWYVILNRVLAGRGIRAAMQSALDAMKSASTVQGLQAVAQAGQGAQAGPFQRLAAEALSVANQRQAQGLSNTGDSGLSYSEFLTRAMRNCIDEETTKMETGLASLASIASSAPFVGLFGTVWGVYNALVSIGLSGQGTLDKVAGPVGEALIMTALGLAVAIPAALAYNAFVRRNRLVQTKLNSFAHDVFAVLTKA